MIAGLYLKSSYDHKLVPYLLSLETCYKILSIHRLDKVIK